MTFPLGSLGAGAAAAKAPRPVPAPARWRQQALLFAGAVAWLLLVLALATHHPADPAFTTSGTGEPVHNAAGLAGAWVADLAYFLFGFSAWWLVPVGLRAWLSLLAQTLRSGDDAPAEAGHPRLRFWAGLALLMMAATALEWTRLYRLEPLLPGHSGGVLGYTLGPLSMRWLGFAGSGVLWIVVLVAGLALALRFSWLKLADAIGERFDGLRERRAEVREQEEDRRIGEQATREREHVVEVERQVVEEHVPIVIEPPVVEVPKSERVAKERQKPLFVELTDTKLPQVDLLDAAPGRQESVTPESLEMTSRLIEKKLKDFGVEVRVVAASPGPVITRYEIEPATGVKGAQIVNLAKDLARSLSLISIRVVEVIPGKNYMALELPNARRQTIRLAEILGSQVYHEAASLLTMGLGKDIVGNPVVADLAKMPHCLVAGTTGSGKSVGINAMILSLLYKAEARDVRLILIDPKMLEMSVYEGIPHLLAPVVTDMKQAANALNWCVGEMERRYKLMSKLGVRNLAGYNKKIADAQAKGEKIGNPFSLTPEEPEPLERLPHVVVVIDELADLMMVVGKKIEELIARLAQKARAAGIHLILATQRPSVDVITGLIKANIPTRLSFQVSSKIDSRTILDQMGAEALLGQGDMLYLPPGSGMPVRVHGAFVSDDEVHRVVEYLKTQGEANYVEGILEGGTLEGDADAMPEGGPSGGGEDDSMYDQAVQVVLQHRRASISLVQRHLRIGYNRAARLLEQMEKSGLVSAMGHNGNRDLLVPKREE
ncbi:MULTISPECIES: DNA translocase FtsK [Rubrivivax]|uniref:DNA translocase FtsK n=1 Tax=Rubrivivax benzoatilyticus TaxID=316997 RepID=A0ABX0HVU7_9BURK|nr:MULTISPECIES: DNA translocase FtsK [Rubrivivax]EGJ10493.1 DNA translocase FtsK [Rubrivivax benzoatilyticus JA2 = ATCC BAA-35]MCD0417713.1 DNA translocase FtsK 4TM domain-containing protein [Rubrivivax sp. JA1024]NHK99140.1 DNA translocase FtsK [Rubrivivax benzoatilyticus]NHL24997.1 DNA translocase FtsK [Rubrivivax benzoatilyticus]